MDLVKQILILQRLGNTKGQRLNCHSSEGFNPDSFFHFSLMSTLANESIFETLFEEALEELGINESSPFFSDAYKLAQTMAMNKFLSNNP